MTATIQMDVSIRVPGQSVVNMVKATLRRIYAGTPHATKTIARRAHKDPRAVKDWLNGLTAPSAESLADLCAAHEELEAEFILMIKERRALCGR